MAFKMETGPLPDNHPLKGGQVIFGQRRPQASAQNSTPVEKPVSPQPAGPLPKV